MLKIVISLSVVLLMSFSSADEPSFKDRQLDNYRVFQAFRDKGDDVYAKLRAVDVKYSSCDILIRIFKFEEDVEIWAKNRDEETYRLVTTYNFCTSVGQLGPKRKEGDKQIPEGIYSLSQFNPASNYFLSLKVNYPNASDRILSDKFSPGGQIYIHGGCHTIGCIPITDEWIKELYVFSVQARNGGQQDIPIHIFPARLTDENYELLKYQYRDMNLLSFWRQLKTGYDLFEETNQVPIAVINEMGEYYFYR